MKKFSKTPDTKNIVERLVSAETVRKGWENVTDRCYGKAVANEMREIAPGDPYLLYDFCGVKLAGAGADQEEIAERLDAYRIDEWKQELEALKAIINRNRPE